MSPRARGGFTLIEMVITMMIALIVVLGMGRLILANQRSWEWGRDKVELQANTTESLEWMARSVRGASYLQVTSATRFRTLDRNRNVLHTYERVTVGGQGRLREDGQDLTSRNCTAFQVTAFRDPVSADTTSVRLLLELQDRTGNRVGASTRAAVRNRALVF